MSKKEAKPEYQDTFLEIIQAIDALEVEPERHLSIQIDATIRDAICAAQASGQSAEVTIKVKAKSGPDRRMNFSATVAAKLPRPPVSGVTLYADPDGGLHKSDPQQLKFPLTTHLANVAHAEKEV